MRAQIKLWGMIALWTSLLSSTALSQDRAWIQIEAQPTLGEAEGRADAYDDLFPNIEGYRLGSRWYGIAIGPYSRDEAQNRLIELRRENMIPPDSYLTNGDNFREQFWPLPGARPEAPVSPVAPPELITEAPLTAEPLAPAQPALPAAPLSPESPAAPARLAYESPEEARRLEAALSPEEKQDLQRALQWAGVYSSGIDGAFGPGTRNSMAAWQSAQGYEPTGVLTSAERATLMGAWQAEIARYGFETITEGEAGIEITLPLGMIRFDHYEPPFAHFLPKTEGGLKVVLISQPGERGAMNALYDNLLGLTMFPAEGPRNRGERGFEIEARSGDVVSHAFAETRQGLIKGYILSYSPQNAEAAEAAPKVLAQMKASFRPLGARALDPGMVPMSQTSRSGMMAGLEIRAPKASLSGFYVDQSGKVLSEAAPLAQCGTITLDGRVEASLQQLDAGLALLTPKTPLAPPAIAAFQLQPARLGAEVTVAGYSYGEALPAPALTFGRLEEAQGLNGESGIKRLAIQTLPGDVGGPVLDGSGAVLGMMRAREESPARVLPEGVEFASAAQVVVESLRAAGVTVSEAQSSGSLPAEDLTRRASGMTVLVNCWD